MSFGKTQLPFLTFLHFSRGRERSPYGFPIRSITQATLNFKSNRRMPFTEAILTECQRMWVVTPIIGPRRVLSDTTLDGYKILKNTTVLINIYSNNMDPENFPDPTSFKPERYINENGTYQPQESIILFGKGQ